MSLKQNDEFYEQQEELKNETMNKEQLEMEISRIEREIEELYEEKDEMKRQLEKLRLEEVTPIKVRNGHGQDYLDYEAKFKDEEEWRFR